MKKILITLFTICLVNSAFAQMGGTGQGTFGSDKEPAKEEKPKPVEEVTGAGTSGTAGSEALKALAAKKNDNNVVSSFKDGEVIVRTPEKSPVAEEYRVALLIGNANYESDKVATAVKDIPALSTSLLNSGYEVIEIRNAPKDVLLKEIDAFIVKSKKAKVSVLYFGGHTVTYNKESYLIPLGVEPASVADLVKNTYSLTKILNSIKADKTDEKQGRESLVVLDVARYNHFYYALQQKSTKAFAPVSAPEGVVVMSASSDGTNALTSTDESLFGYVLAKQIQPAKAIADVTKSTKSEVERLSEGTQKPWVAGKPSKTPIGK